jgi:2-oxoglutarate dehydrogenase E2 component (dihydrolipoamide succinyltransferase)
MATEIRVPTLGESVTEATIGQWYKEPGDAVAMDEPLVELETDKVTIEVPAPAAGSLSEISVKEGETVEVGALLGMIAEGEGAPAAKPDQSAAPAAKAEGKPEPKTAAKGGDMPPSPAAAKMLSENKMDAGDVAGSGKRGQVLKEDVIDAMTNRAKSACA